MMQIISRADAKAAGLKRYFTGKPCKHDHIVERFVIAGNCIECCNGPGRKEYKKDWETRNSDRLANRKRDRRAGDPEKFSSWWSDYYARHSDEIIARASEWNKDHPDLVWAARHPAENVAKVAAWRQANPLKKNALDRNRRARINGAEGTHTAADIEWLFKKQKGRCAHSWCRVSIENGHHCDHVIPLALGGSNGRKNLQLLCAPCNMSKHARHPIDHAQRNGMLL